MKKYVIGIVLFMSVFVLSAQELTDKNFTFPQSYGQKKFKKAPRKVYISTFNVHYQISAYGTNSDGGAFGPAAIASVGATLSGIEESDLKQLTDSLYQAVTSSLQSNGFELLDHTKAGQTKTYADWQLVRGGTIEEKHLFGLLTSTPSEFSYYIKGISKKGKEKGGAGIGLGRQAKLSKQLNDAIILDFDVVVSFIEFKGKKARVISKAKLTAEPKLHIAVMAQGIGKTQAFSPTYSKVSFIYGNPAAMAATAALITQLKTPYISTSNFIPNEVVEADANGIPGFISSEQIEYMINCKSGEYKKEAAKLLFDFKDYVLKNFFDFTN